jgi:hypothetical protein
MDKTETDVDEAGLAMNQVEPATPEFLVQRFLP